MALCIRQAKRSCNFAAIFRIKQLFCMKKSLIALAFGTLALGIAEFTMMGILPYVAA